VQQQWRAAVGSAPAAPLRGACGRPLEPDRPEEPAAATSAAVSNPLAPPPRVASPAASARSQVVQEIKLLRSTVLSRDKERAERATLVVQEKLIRGKVPLGRGRCLL
jgi:hypothetical protein